MNFLNDLNEQQLKAVTAPLGPVLVLAGAGSGKTRALIYRVAYLIQSRQFEPRNILAVTFTNKAAGEMSERTEGLLEFKGPKPDGYRAWLSDRPTTGTFHSLGARILRKEINRLKPFTSSFTIFDTDDSLRAIKQVVKSVNWDEEINPNQVRAIISAVKNRQLDPKNVEDEKFVLIYNAYNKLLAELNALDFDDLLLFTARIFSQYPKVLQKYQNHWPYVLIDEYQDTNDLQYELIRLLVGKDHNIFAVGDDAQSIYGFRGANYKNILNFEKDFPDATVFTLEQNYRSTQNILTAANNIIKLSPAQKKKKLWTNNGDGGKVICHTGIDEVAEAMFVAKEIIALASGEEKSESLEPEYVPELYDFEDSQTPIFDSFLNTSKFRTAALGPSKHIFNASELLRLKEIAILYRTNAQSRVIEEVMLRFGIPYHLVGSVRFYERREIKDVLSFLRLLSNPKDILSLERVINVPTRGIGEKSFNLIRHGLEANLSPRAASAWREFQQRLDGVRLARGDKTLVDIVRLLTGRFDLEKYYRDGTAEGEDRWENIKELLSVAARFNNLPWPAAVEELLAEIALYSETDEVGSKQSVTLMTLHQAKGLEFDNVFIVGLEEGLLPHTRSLEPGADLSEEIRLAYVGFTRARKNLYLLNTYARRIFGANTTLKPSRILKAVPEELIERRE